MKRAENARRRMANGLAHERANAAADTGALARISRACHLPLPARSPIQRGGPGQPFPGAPIFGGLPRPEQFEQKNRRGSMSNSRLIFDDMLISILTAQKTVGQAFAGLAIGIVDTFAIEFTKALRESFITPVIRGLTDMLQSALKDLFGGLECGRAEGRLWRHSQRHRHDLRRLLRKWRHARAGQVWRGGRAWAGAHLQRQSANAHRTCDSRERGQCIQHQRRRECAIRHCRQAHAGSACSNGDERSEASAAQRGSQVTWPLTMPRASLN